MITQTPTIKGWLAFVPRAACGHMFCAGRDACVFLPLERPALRIVDQQEAQ